jgi:hypothetical protein
MILVFRFFHPHTCLFDLLFFRPLILDYTLASFASLSSILSSLSSLFSPFVPPFSPLLSPRFLGLQFPARVCWIVSLTPPKWCSLRAASTWRMLQTKSSHRVTTSLATQLAHAFLQVLQTVQGLPSNL